MPAEKTINVNLGDRTYDIFLGKDLEKFIEEWILRVYPERKIFVVIDASFNALYEEDIQVLFKNIPHETIAVELSEERKNFEIAEKVYGFLLDKECDRESLIVAFGGGITGDVVGFCAATFMRGVDFIQIPTTLLAQVDSSVGGKTGINFRDGKNIIGAFYQPCAVFIDVKYLSTLDDRNFMAGLAEVLKVGFVGDQEIIESLRGKTVEDIRSDDIELMKLIGKSVQYKVGVVTEDEKELGLRKVLNFGHTIGHAIEEAAGYRGLLHGEAITAGIAIEVQISLLSGSCPEESRNIVISVLEDLGYDILPENVDYSDVFSLLTRDKKRVMDTIVTPVLKDIGAFEFKEFQLKDYEKYAIESLNFLKGFKEAKLGSKLKMELFDDLDVLESSGRFNDAENLVKKYLEKDPKNKQLNSILAQLYTRQRNNEAALKVIDEMLQLNPEDKEAIAMKQELEGELVKAQMQADAPDSTETVITIGEDVYQIEGIDESDERTERDSEELVEEEIVKICSIVEETGEDVIDDEEMEGEVPVLTQAMAEMLLKEGKKDKSLDVIDEILQKDPDNSGLIALKEKILSLKKREVMLAKYRDVLEKFLEKIVEEYA